MSPDNLAIKKEQFTALYSSYARVYERFLENGFKTSTLVLVVLGWLLTSESARSYLTEDRTIAVICMIGVTVGACYLWATFHRLYQLSEQLRTKLDEVAFLAPEYYDQHRIPTLIYWSVIGQNTGVCALIVVVMYRLAFC